MPEKQWSCGCMEVDGKLVNECKTTPFNPVCFRKQQEGLAKHTADKESAHVEYVAEHKPVLVQSEVNDGVQS